MEMAAMMSFHAEEYLRLACKNKVSTGGYMQQRSPVPDL